jgi:hypothetical protein
VDLVAVGDAAMRLDPLSSSGLRYGLRLAAPAAEAVLGLLRADREPARRYAGLVGAVFAAHPGLGAEFDASTGPGAALPVARATTDTG